MTAKRQTAKERTNFLCRRRNGHIRDRNFLNTICNIDDDDGGLDDVKNGDSILTGVQGEGNTGGEYEEYNTHGDCGETGVG